MLNTIIQFSMDKSIERPLRVIECRLGPPQAIMKTASALMITFSCAFCHAQQNIVIQVTGGENKMPLAGSIRIKETRKSFATDTAGLATIRFLANGTYTLTVSAVEYSEEEVRISIPYPSDTLRVNLERMENELEEIIIQ